MDTALPPKFTFILNRNLRRPIAQKIGFAHPVIQYSLWMSYKQIDTVVAIHSNCTSNVHYSYLQLLSDNLGLAFQVSKSPVSSPEFPGFSEPDFPNLTSNKLA